MLELEFVKNERVKLQNQYLKEARNIWIEFEGEEAEKKYKSLYNKYKNKDKFLEVLQSRLESCLEDIEFYKGDMGNEFKRMECND